MINEQIKTALAILAEAKHVVALTGAGISTPSGIPDFRSPSSGMWDHIDPFEVASMGGFQRRPQAFYDWIHPLTKLTMEAKPNLAHFALAELEQQGKLKAIITQNIDVLHHKAGSKAVYEVHGHLRSMTCIKCFAQMPSEVKLPAFIETGDVPKCDTCGGVLKPDVILFGEQLPMSVFVASQEHSRLCDVMIVAGSSLVVAPAGDLPILAKQHGAKLIIVNYDETHVDYMADVIIRGDVAEVLPQFV